MLKIFVGYDKEIEPVAYHVFCESVIRNSSIPVSFIPLEPNNIKNKFDLKYFEFKRDGSNCFIYSRFLIPYLCNFQGYALYVDGDMLCRADISDMLEDIDLLAAVSVVKHDYKTKYPVKYLGHINEDYPRKNWSSVIFWNCSHPAHKVLTPDYIKKASGKHLHRFEWLDDVEIHNMPKEWNWLVSEYKYNNNAKIAHFTLGTPCFSDYKDCDYAKEWYDYYNKLIKPLS